MFHSATILASLIFCTSAVPARPVTISQILHGDPISGTVTVSGQVVETFPDETDSRYHHIYLFEDGELLNVAVKSNRFSEEFKDGLMDAHVRIEGSVVYVSDGLRRHCPPFISQPDRIDILTPPDRATKIQPLGAVDDLNLVAIRKLGRRSATGKVLATWQDDSLLLFVPSSGLIRVHLSRSARMPKVGDSIKTVGLVHTDSIDIILKCATWVSAPPVAYDDAPVVPFGPEDLDDLRAHSHFNRATVRVRGTVVYVPDATSADGSLLLKVGAHAIRVDPGNQSHVFDGLFPSSEAEVTGIGLCRIDPETQNLPFARFKEFQIILRAPSDIRVLSRPSWWTPKRLVVIIGILMALLIGLYIWNKTLQGVILRRGQQLAAEQLARDKAEVKFDERTRLAVELHDSLSQTLTGAAMEVRAAETMAKDSTDAMLRHLSTAGQTLQSCREELRNCLWDLRSRTLEVPDMTAAVLRTLQPHVNESRLAVRFNVARSLLADTTAHTILRIIRELVLNAIRHGKAESVRVAGCLDGGRLLLSVEDDGCGFDPNSAPGVVQGHFGIQGIRERLRKIDGRLDIASRPGKGTRATVSIPLIQNEKQQ